MGIEVRAVGPLPPVSSEDLVPDDHADRRSERALDLSFVRDLVRDAYAGIGRPSVGPVVFFKLQLVLFFEGLRSERQLLRVVADRPSPRWYLGYDLTEHLPDRSNLTRARDRYGLAGFRRCSEQIVGRCRRAGLVWRGEPYIAATKAVASAAHEPVGPWFAGDRDGEGGEAARDAAATAPAPRKLPVALTEEARAARRGPPRPDRRGRGARPRRHARRLPARRRLPGQRDRPRRRARAAGPRPRAAPEPPSRSGWIGG